MEKCGFASNSYFSKSFKDTYGEPPSKYAKQISELIASSAQVRGTGIARRTPEYIVSKIENKNAIIALDGDVFAGFCYIETWSHDKYVANSGLIVDPKFRGHGLAKKIKAKIFNHARDKFPSAKVFGITTSLPVMKINSELGYKPVTFSELTQDDTFWKQLPVLNPPESNCTFTSLLTIASFGETSYPPETCLIVPFLSEHEYFVSLLNIGKY